MRLSSSSSTVIPTLSAISSSVGRAHQALLELRDRPLDLTGARAHRARHPVERAQLVDDRAPDARDRVRLELDLAIGIEPLDRPDQAEQPVRDEILLVDVRRQARPETAGDELDERRIGEDEPVPERLLAGARPSSCDSRARERQCRRLVCPRLVRIRGRRPNSFPTARERALRARSPIHSARAPAASATTHALPPASAAQTATAPSESAMAENRMSRATRCIRSSCQRAGIETFRPSCASRSWARDGDRASDDIRPHSSRVGSGVRVAPGRDVRSATLPRSPGAWRNW